MALTQGREMDRVRVPVASVTFRIAAPTRSISAVVLPSRFKGGALATSCTNRRIQHSADVLGLQYSFRPYVNFDKGCLELHFF
eukprot:m.44798 g.44798  ORF g.44798 m.44798 type:complete len:83 (+) comp15105_c0_seq2:847-1095(+)